MINKIKENVFQLNFREFGSCVYLIIIKNIKIIIDASSEENQKELISDLKQLNLKPKDINIILLTHSHYDHIGNLNLFKNAKIYSEKNIEKLNEEINKNKELKEIKVIKTPGHTRDSICFLYKNILFSGDTLFHNGIGRTDLAESEPEKMQESLEKLKKIKYKILCPGHVD